MIINAEGEFVVQIKRSTFARNPNAGHTVSNMAGVSNLQAILSYSNKLDGILDKKFRLFGVFPVLTIDEQEITIAPPPSIASFDFLKKEIEARPEAKLELCCIKKTTDVHAVEHLPLPDYLFEYEDSNVICKRCHSIFSHNSLRSDSLNDTDSLDDKLVDNICPVCGLPYCCEVKYENPNKVAKELGLK